MTEAVPSTAVMSATLVGAREQSADVRDYIALLKPRVMALVVFSGLVGVLMAPGALHPFLAFVAVLCIALATGGCASVNMWYDRDIDAVMSRTRRRPLPQGRIEPTTALEFGAALIAAAVLLMGLAVNAMAAALLALAVVFYVFVYTVALKRRTPWNIVIGGAAGAFPPMIGWAAVTGRVDLASLLLFAVIFFWTPPHFWALALYRNEDYRRAGVPMLPVCKGARRTKIEMLVYTLLLLPLSLAPVWIGLSGLPYGAVAALLSAGFIVMALRVLGREDDRPARQMFFYSLFYLSGLFAAMLVDRFLRGWL